jgi:hypothetical protein
MRIQIAGCSIKEQKRIFENPIFNTFAEIETCLIKMGHTVEAKPFLGLMDKADFCIMFGSVTNRKRDTTRAIFKDKLLLAKVPTFHFDTGLFSVYVRNKIKQNETWMFRMGLNDCCGTGDFLNENMPGQRYKTFKKLFNFTEKDPITNKDGSILFLLQSEKGWQYNDSIPFWQYARNKVEEIRKITDRPIILRAHPNPDRERPNKIAEGFKDVTIEYADRSRREVLDSIRGSFAVVTHSSSAAVESIVEGIPTFALDERCIAYKACEQDLTLLESIDKVNWDKRQQQLYNWAYTTWHLNEWKDAGIWDYYIKKGKALGHF